MKNEKLKAKVLSVRIIANISEELAKVLEISGKYSSIGIITADCDDVTYTALDEATKAAAVEVIYGKSMYGGATNASTKLAGEVIGILGGENPAEVKSGISAVLDYFESGDSFVSATEDNSVVYYAHTVSSAGTYLSKLAGVKEGAALAYLIAPPLEAVAGLDAALKAADVTLTEFFAPPSETNFGGGLLTGTQSACTAAARAFAEKVTEIAENPKEV